MISGDVRNTHASFYIPIASDRSCSDKRGLNNKAIKLKLLCFLYMYAYKLHVK